MTRAGLQALLSHWWRNPLQLFTLLAGLALATALWSGVQAVNGEARASYDAAAATLGEGRYDQIVAADGGAITTADYVALRRAGWLVSPVAEGRVAGVRIVGVEPLTAPGGLGPIQVMQENELVTLLAGDTPFYGGAVAIDALEGAVVGDLIVAADVAPNTVITDIGAALELGAQIQRLLVLPEQPVGTRDLPDRFSRRAGQGGADIGALTDSFHLNLTAFGFLSFAVGIFIVHGAIGLAFEQRRPVVRTLRALGMPLGRLMALMAVELLVLALFAGAIGVVLGYVVAGVLLPDVAATLRGIYGADVGGDLQLRTAWWLQSIAIAVGGTAVAAGGAMWQMRAMPLLAAAQPRALAMAAGRGARVQAVAAVVLLAVALALAVFGAGLVAGFALLAAMLIGAALALPLVIAGILAAGQAVSRGVIGNWFWADTRQQLPGLSLALMALLLAMAANVGVTTMVSSFRLTFVGFLDQRLTSELYVTADDPAQFETDVTPLVDAVLPIQSADITIAGQPVEIYGNRDHATYRDNWQFLSAAPGAWDAVAAGQGILINEQLARRGGLAVGDVVDVGAGLRVVGIHGDYGNPIGQAVIGEALFARLYPDVVPARFGLRMDPADVEPLRTRLAAEFGVPAGAMVNQAGIKAFSLGVFDRTFTVTTALNVLTLSVAGFAILMSLLTLAAMRVPQMAPAWAMGLTRAQLGALELARAVLLAVITAAVALPLGLALAWVLLAVVNVAAFGWELPLFFFPADYAKLGGFAVLAAVLAAMWPAFRLARTPPADLLKVFSNAR